VDGFIGIFIRRPQKFYVTQDYPYYFAYYYLTSHQYGAPACRIFYPFSVGKVERRWAVFLLYELMVKCLKAETYLNLDENCLVYLKGKPNFLNVELGCPIELSLV